MNKIKQSSQSTNLRRSPPNWKRPPPKIQRPLISCKKFTAHQFKEYRKKRGFLIREMRIRRGLSQSYLGSPSQIRLYEQGRAVQIGTMEILARIVPCPREMMKLWKNALQNLPVACVECRKVCRFKGQNEGDMMQTIMHDITES